MRTTTAIPTEIKAASKREQSQVRLSSAEREQAQATLKVLMNHIYELNKGVRHMVLFTCNKKYSELAIQRLESQGIPYVLTRRATEPECLFRAARVSGGHPAHRHTSAESTHARRGLYPWGHARLRPLRTM